MEGFDLRGALQEIRDGVKRVKAQVHPGEFDLSEFKDAVARLRASRERFQAIKACMRGSELKDMAEIFADVKRSFSAASAHFKKSGDIAKGVR